MRTSNALPLLVFVLSASPAGPVFDVAAIKPAAAGTRESMTVEPGGHLVANGLPLKFLISTAYRTPAFEILGADGWLSDDRWFIEAKAADLINVPVWAPPYLPEAVAVRLRALLEDRFELKWHREKRQVQAYTLAVSKNGSTLAPPDLAPRGPMAAGPGRIEAYAVTMDQFVLYLNRIMDLPVIDMTGLSEKYRFTLQFAPESARPLASPASSDGAAASSDPTIFDAIKGDLGLELKRAKEPVDVLIIDSARRPAGN